MPLMARRAPILSGDWRTRLLDPRRKRRSVECANLRRLFFIFVSLGNGSKFVEFSQERIREMPGLAGPGQAGPQIGRTGPLTSLPGQETNLGRRAEGQVRRTSSNSLYSLEQSMSETFSIGLTKCNKLTVRLAFRFCIHQGDFENSENCWKG